MFAQQSREQSKKTAEGKSRQGESTPDQKEARQSNSIWQTLALRPAFIHPKLSVSQPDDPHEQEADRIADKVMRMPEHQVQRKCEACETTASTCPTCAEDVTVHRKAESASEPMTAPDSMADQLGAGRPLEFSARTFFEPRFGQDLSNVRIHTDGVAADAATNLNAHAFTLGQHIAFAQGQYAPDSTHGRHLIAHELTHVLQSGAPMLSRSAVPANQAQVPTESGESPPLNQGQVVPATVPLAPVIPRPETCPPPKDMSCVPASTPPGAVTNTIIFPHNSAALNATQVKELDTAAAHWHTAGASVPVRVDGYASAEGGCEYNWSLSCKRAQTVAAALRSPSDGSKGVPDTSIGKFAHGESDAAGRALAPNRKATVSIPVPPPPPAPAVPACVLPVLLGRRRGCGGGTDFTHFDFPSISTASAAKLAAWALAHPGTFGARSLVTNIECELEMDAALTGLAGSAGHNAFARFRAGTGGTETLNNTSTLGALALVSASFLATVAAVKASIETQLAAQAASGALNACALSVTPPSTHFSFSDGVALKAVIFGTHGEQLFATSFSGSIPLRTYTITLHFLICDDFGVDEADLYAPGLFPFWVLQHERSATLYAPFINQLDLTVTETGTF